MESVKETFNSATSAVSNAIYGGGTQTQEHKSMIDDHVSKGTYSGKVETAKDAMNTDGIEPSDPSKIDKDQASGSSQGTSKSPSGPGGMSSPQGANVTGHDTNADTNKDPLSNKDEPNRGFGGGGKGSSAEPSVSAGGAGDLGQPKLPDEKSSEEGTGTQYVKSTGLKADGGDFDASVGFFLYLSTNIISLRKLEIWNSQIWYMHANILIWYYSVPEPVVKPIVY